MDFLSWAAGTTKRGWKQRPEESFPLLLNISWPGRVKGLVWNIDGSYLSPTGQRSELLWECSRGINPGKCRFGILQFAPAHQPWLWKVIWLSIPSVQFEDLFRRIFGVFWRWQSWAGLLQQRGKKKKLKNQIFFSIWQKGQGKKKGKTKKIENQFFFSVWLKGQGKKRGKLKKLKIRFSFQLFPQQRAAWLPAGWGRGYWCHILYFWDLPLVIQSRNPNPCLPGDLPHPAEISVFSWRNL